MSGRFWEFQQLTDSLRGTSHLDLVPRTNGKLYIGGVAALYQEPDPLEKAGITHVVSALDFDLHDAKQLAKYERLLIQVDDVPDEDLLRHFPRVVEFIDGAVEEGGGGKVFVHCAMGVSRSATVVVAWLVWKGRGRVGVVEALEQVREGRKRVRPNAGFVRQLEVWHGMVERRGGWDEEMYMKWKDGKSGGAAKL